MLVILNISFNTKQPKHGQPIKATACNVHMLFINQKMACCYNSTQAPTNIWVFTWVWAGDHRCWLWLYHSWPLNNNTTYIYHSYCTNVCFISVFYSINTKRPHMAGYNLEMTEVICDTFRLCHSVWYDDIMRYTTTCTVIIQNSISTTQWIHYVTIVFVPLNAPYNIIVTGKFGGHCHYEYYTPHYTAILPTMCMQYT